jgi:hypothetical protein
MPSWKNAESSGTDERLAAALPALPLPCYLFCAPDEIPLTIHYHGGFPLSSASVARVSN